MKEVGLWISAKLIKDCGLNGNDLLIYAYIYNYSQDGKSKYYGTIKHLSETFNISKRAVINILNRLLKEKLIYKYIKNGNNVCYSTYKEGEESAYSEESAHSEESAPNSEESAHPTNNKDIIKIKQNNNIYKPPTFDEIQNYCIANNTQIDIQAFIDYYEEHEWKRYDKNLKKYIPIKNWKSAIRNWERNTKKYEEEKLIKYGTKKAYIKDVKIKEKELELKERRMKTKKEEELEIWNKIINEGGIDDYTGNIHNNENDTKLLSDV